MSDHQLRKILHSYIVVFRDQYLDDHIRHPNYDLVYTLDNEYPFFNCACNIDLSADSINKELDFIEGYFRRRQKDPSVSIESSTKPNDLDQILKARGYDEMKGENCLLWVNGKGLEKKKFDVDVKFKIASDFASFQDYLETAKNGWSDVFEYTRFASSMSKLFNKQSHGISTFHLIGYIEDLPVCSSSLCIYDGLCHLVNISVIPKYRRRGVASRMIQYGYEIANNEIERDIYICIDQNDLPANEVLKSLDFEVIIDQRLFTKPKSDE